jgi:hypothetical protein
VTGSQRRIASANGYLQQSPAVRTGRLDISLLKART